MFRVERHEDLHVFKDPEMGSMLKSQVMMKLFQIQALMVANRETQQREISEVVKEVKLHRTGMAQQNQQIELIKASLAQQHENMNMLKASLKLSHGDGPSEIDHTPAPSRYRVLENSLWDGSMPSVSYSIATSEFMSVQSDDTLSDVAEGR